MDKDERLKYLNRNTVKKYGGWKNHSKNVYSILHWENNDSLQTTSSKILPIERTMKRPSTAPPIRFGAESVDFLIDTVQNLQCQVKQQNILIENLTDVVDKLSIQPKHIITEDLSDKENDNIINTQPKTSKSNLSSPRKKINNPTNNNKDNTNKTPIVIDQNTIINSYFAVNSEDIAKQRNPSPKDKKCKQKRQRRKSPIKKKQSLNKKKMKNKSITPRVVKSNKTKNKIKQL
eukprot:71837_1